MRRVLGLMSGTSLDGLDACLARFWDEGSRVRFEIEAFATYPYPTDLKEAVIRQLDPVTSRVDALCELDAWLGEWFADGALRLIQEAGLTPEDVDLIGSHGQTIFHLPQGPHPSTMQLGDGSVIAVRTGLTTIHDFRPADMAAGGQGAPLVPYADRALFSDPDHAVALLNLGGIANVTLLRPAGDDLQAFDTGPGNMILDRFVERMTRGAQTFDTDGRIGSKGHVRPELLDEWMSHPFLLKAPPKSTGREEFGHAYADARYDEAIARGVAPEDLVATATAFTAHSVATALRAWASPRLRPQRVIVSGGGARNPVLMRMLQEALRPAEVASLGPELADAKEALAFALFAFQASRGLSNHAPEATGAREALVLGKIAPGRNFAGLRLLRPLPEGTVTERPNPLTLDLDAMDTYAILEVMNQEDERVLAAIDRAKPQLAAVIGDVERSLRQGGRLFYVGAGTSGRLGVLDAAECPPTFSTPSEWVQGLIAGGERALLKAVEGAEDDRAAGASDLESRNLGPMDVVVGIAASGRTPYVHGALAYARAQGARTALISCNPLGERPEYVDTLIELVVGPEILTGSTRLKAGTVTKLALNMISTVAMVRLGKVYGNRMVDVNVSNAKLQQRALRMTQELGRVEPAMAERLLSEANGRVKVAVAMARLGVTASEAETRLEAARGFLRRVIGDPGS
ncbi:MAG TPA: anhydro-N-acetylmuramic acid kinase [Stenomitos sp.]